jgi:hypothetical protein
MAGQHRQAFGGICGVRSAYQRNPEQVRGQRRCRPGDTVCHLAGYLEHELGVEHFAAETELVRTRRVHVSRTLMAVSSHSCDP